MLPGKKYCKIQTYMEGDRPLELTHALMVFTRFHPLSDRRVKKIQAKLISQIHQGYFF